ncbi:hypothetical protein GGX14DRAFT_397781 [Mycena pura]|uniref:Uncharacterized protein n=1 Tax=Mycena pura TaxID=153505 RepID=A0AAD6VEY8_9AGAR|nr:hypothetical protein GGX14DRAFT_397781 [Mycena pura]
MAEHQNAAGYVKFDTHDTPKLGSSAAPTLFGRVLIDFRSSATRGSSSALPLSSDVLSRRWEFGLTEIMPSLRGERSAQRASAASGCSRQGGVWGGASSGVRGGKSRPAPQQNDEPRGKIDGNWFKCDTLSRKCVAFERLS